MPQNGEVNDRFGVFKNLCCGAEIVIAENMEFPECPNHPKLTTVWKPIVNDDILSFSDKKNSVKDPAA